MKAIVGAGNTSQIGWISLQKTDLDIRDSASWQRMFQPNSLDAILAEHVLEHLTIEEAKQAVSNAFQYLKPNGYFRIAVPDGFHPEPDYIRWVAPVIGWNGDDHKTLFNYQNLTRLLQSVGFNVYLLEWFDEFGRFNKQTWFQQSGVISRAKNTSWSSLISFIIGADYTSLIVDAVKP